MNSYSSPGVENFIVVRGHIKGNGTYEMSLMMEMITEFYQISEKDIKSAWRKRPVVWARHVFCYLCSKYVQCSIVSIGKVINRDHTSVIHARQNVSNLMDSDPDLREQVKGLETRVITSKIVGKL